MTDYGLGVANDSSASPPLALWQACTKLDLDNGRRRCPDCPLKYLCESESRWLVKAFSQQRRRDRM